MRTAPLLTLCTLLFTVALRAQEDERPVVDDKAVTKEAAANAALPTLWIVGDSTLKSSKPMRGWGQEIGEYFDPAKINVVNRAIGGRSSRTFIGEGKWDAVLGGMRSGDFVLVQFGHNDVGPLDEKGKFRGSIKSEGEETEDVTKADGSVESVHSFGWYMRKYGADAKAKNVTAILCSMVPHKAWKDGKIRRGESETFVKWTDNAAKATGAYFIDLNAIVARGYEELGEEKVEPLFADKGTHTSVEGAKYNARAVIAGLKALPKCSLVNYLSPAAKDIAPATPR